MQRENITNKKRKEEENCNKLPEKRAKMSGVHEKTSVTRLQELSAKIVSKFNKMAVKW